MIKSNILITGASSGVGFSLVRALKDDYNVITLSRRTCKLRESFGTGIYSYDCDITNRAELNKSLENIKNKHGQVLYIINNAGVLIPGQYADLNDSDIDYSIELNALAPMSIVKFFLDDMVKADFGRIINITSGAPLNCFAGYGAYSASKSVLNSLSITLSNELKNTNIKLNLMSPGPVKSEMSPDALMEPEVCHPTVKYLLGMEKEVKGGGFYWLGYKVPLFPDLEGVQWLEGIGNHKLERVL